VLKRKEAVNYRKALIRKDGGMRCKCCVYRQFVQIFGIGGGYLYHDYRCEVIGFDNSRRYSIAADHVCDRFIERKLNTNTESEVIPYPAITSHRKCEKCGEEMRHHGYLEKENKTVCPVGGKL
jgi:hypothetical protein